MRRRILAPILIAALAGCASPGEGEGAPAADTPVERCPACLRPFAEEPLAAAIAKASVGGRYRDLLRIIEIPGDRDVYGEFREWGHWQGSAYRGYGDLPAGWWVYVHPRWYVWGRREPAGGAGVDPP